MEFKAGDEVKIISKSVGMTFKKFIAITEIYNINRFFVDAIGYGNEICIRIGAAHIVARFLKEDLIKIDIQKEFDFGDT